MASQIHSFFSFLSYLNSNVFAVLHDEHFEKGEKIAYRITLIDYLVTIHKAV